MTVSANSPKQNFIGNGIAVAFIFTIKCIDDTWIHAYIDDVEENQADITVVLNPDQESTPGGTVTFNVTTPPDLSTVTISREVPLSQGTDFPLYGAFPAEANEDALDKLTYVGQQLADQIDRSLKFPISESSAGDLGSIAVRANKYLGFNASGDFVYLPGSSGDPTAMQLVSPAPPASEIAVFGSGGQVVSAGETIADVESNAVAAATAAILAAIPGYTLIDEQIFTANGVWTKPAGCTAVEVVCIGGGGGGGGARASISPASTSVVAAAGGAGGGFARSFLTSGFAATENVTVGVGGVAGIGGGASGGAGAVSKFGASSLVSAAGGTGGKSITSSNADPFPVNASSNNGGAGLVGDLLITGEDGGNGYENIEVISPASTLLAILFGNSNGGNAPMGFSTSPGKGIVSKISAAGVVTNTAQKASGYGGGGQGGILAVFSTTANNNADGAAGSNGIVIVRAYG